MTLLRLELLRYTRTRRIVPLLAVFVLFGIGGPVLAKYLPDLLQNQTSENITIIVSEAAPADGVSIFASNANQLGLIVSLIIVAGAFAVDASPGLSTFYRTRVRPFDRVIVPRYLVGAGLVSLCYVFGALGAWYETTVLLGHVDAGGYLAGIALTIVYLWFAVAVVVLTASLARSVVATAAGAIGIVLALPIVSVFGPLEPWLPTKLAGAQLGLVRDDSAGDYLRATLVSLTVMAAIGAMSLRRLRRREI